MLFVEACRLSLRHFESENLSSLCSLVAETFDVRRYFRDGTRSPAQTREELEWHQHGHPRNPIA